MAMYGLRFASRFARLAGRGLRGVARRLPRAFRMRPRRRVGRKKVANKVHTYIRWADKDALYPSTDGPNQIDETGANRNLVYTFKLDNVVNPSDFTNLYDQYRINKVELFLERYQNSTNGTNPAFNKKIAVVHDYDDANPLTQEDDYLEYSNCKRYNAVGNGSIKITLYPKILNTVLGVNGGPAYTTVPSNRVWLDLAEDDVPHFGLKIFVPGGITTDGYSIFKVRARFHISMKNSK